MRSRLWIAIQICEAAILLRKMFACSDDLEGDVHSNGMAKDTIVEAVSPLIKGDERETWSSKVRIPTLVNTENLLANIRVLIALNKK